MQDVYPVLTPMAVDSSRPFPLIRNKSLNIGALISDKADESEYDFATVQVPSVLPRFIEIPSENREDRTLMLLEQVIEKNIQKLFLNYKVICAYPYRIMRNADLSIDEEDAADLLKEIQKQLKKRQWGEVIRLEVEDGMDKRLLKTLKKAMNVGEASIYRINGPLDLTFLMKVNGLEGYEHLKYPKYQPQIPGIFIRKKIYSVRSGGRIFSWPIHSRALIRWWTLCARLQRTRRCWRLNRPCTGSAAIHRSSLPWRKLRKTESR